ncbi:hypothetical protein ACFZBE_41365 [Streptomyces sp. NPDC008061]|uniref:hypothetical protein n=1 Tax=Streptomyces sp. NPDC008061 TaxID=3364805 RepID=UPI0036F06CD8
MLSRLDTPGATFPRKIASGAGSIVDSQEYPSNALREIRAVIGSGPCTLDSFDKRNATLSVNDVYKGAAEVKNSGVTCEDRMTVIDMGDKR